MDEEVVLEHTAEEVDDNIDEVVAARGTYNSLGDRFDEIEKDRAALAELVDGGAKNALPMADELSGTLASAATVNADGSVTITLSEALSADGGVNYTAAIAAGTYTYSAIDGSSTAEGASYDSYIQKRIDDAWTTVIRDNDTSPGKVAALDAGEYRVTLRLRSGLAAGEYTFRPMLCTTAAYAISPAYQPYRPSYQELYDMVKALQT